MESIQAEVLQQFEELVLNDKKSECMLIFETAYDRIKNEWEKAKIENDTTKILLRDEGKLIKEQLSEKQHDTHRTISDNQISVKVQKIRPFNFFQLIQRLEEEFQHFKTSIATYKEEKETQKKLVKSLIDMIYLLNSEKSICLQNDVSIDYEEMIENMKEIAKFGDDLSKHLKNVQEKQKKTLDNEKSVEKFGEVNREDSNLSLENVLLMMVALPTKIFHYIIILATQYQLFSIFHYPFQLVYRKMNEIWKRSHSRGSKNEDNWKMDEWEVLPTEVTKRVDANKYAGVIRETVSLNKEINKPKKFTQNIVIGGLKWKMELYRNFHDHLDFKLSCELEDRNENSSSKWQCTVTYDLRILDRFGTKSLHLCREMKNFKDDDKWQHFVFHCIDEINCSEDIKLDDTIHIEIEIVVLDFSGIPRQHSSFTNPDYHQILAKLPFTFSNISFLKGDCMKSDSFKFYGYTWMLSITDFHGSLSVEIHCDCDGELFWSCRTEIVFRLMKKSSLLETYTFEEIGELNESHSTLRFSAYISWVELINPTNGYVKNDCIKPEVVLKTFKPIYSINP